MLQYITGVWNNKCPRCREGDLFVEKNPYILKETSHMHTHCPVCGQVTEIEVGFYYGTGYVSYALTVAFSVATWVAWKVLIGMTFDLDDNRIFFWFFSNAIAMLLLQPILMRLSRVLFLSWFVPYDKDWKNKKPKAAERRVEGQMNNW